jgi:hypothetical protein
MCSRQLRRKLQAISTGIWAQSDFELCRDL